MGMGLWVLNLEQTYLGRFWVHIYGSGVRSGIIYLDPSGFGSDNEFRTRPNP